MTGGSQDDEAELFRRVLADAEPLKRKRPVAKKAAARKDDAPQAVLRKSPRRPAPIIRPPELPTPPPPVAANDFSRMDRRTAVRFRRGKLPIEARLDLHGHYQDAAHYALNEFIADSAAADRRMVLVITGRGSREGSGVLRARLPQWLNQPPCRDRVLAFTAARPEHGGDGAFYVLLKRNRDRRA
ncbi:MAG: Smr/MutS family protein [Alphaproteobacteria bacterium]